MILYLRVLCGFGLFGLGFFIFKDDGMVARAYADWYGETSAYYQARFPETFTGPMQLLLLLGWIVLVTTGYYFLEKPLDLRRQFLRFHPTFFQKLYGYFQLYFNNRLHELERNTLTHFLQQPAAHETAIVGALYALREALIHAYKPADVRVSLLIPQAKHDGVPRLYIEYWANEARKTPTTRKLDFGFERRAGFAGWAWERDKPQVGRKKKLFVLPEPRYRNPPHDQDKVKSFCAIPIFDEGPAPGRRPLLGVLCIDADRYFYFPSRRRNVLDFCESLRPLLILIQFHLIYREKLLDDSTIVEEDSTPAPPVSPDEEGFHT